MARLVNLFFMISLFSLVTVSAVVPAAFSFSQDPQASIAEAESALRRAFSDVLDAERSGANVSGLTGRLTQAGAVLTEAEVTLGAGDVDGAVALANSSKTLADGVSENAKILKSGTVAGTDDWFVPIGLSGVAAGAFVVSLYLIWRWFKKYYSRKIMNSRPEVSV